MTCFALLAFTVSAQTADENAFLALFAFTVSAQTADENAKQRFFFLRTAPYRRGCSGTLSKTLSIKWSRLVLKCRPLDPEVKPSSATDSRISPVVCRSRST